MGTDEETTGGESLEQQEEAINRFPDMTVVQHAFALSRQSEVPQSETTQEAVFARLAELHAAPMFEYFHSTYGLFQKDKKTTDLVAKWSAANDDKIKQLDAAVADAEENLGESEVRQCLQAKANYLTQIGHKEEALSAHRVAYEKTVGTGQRLDVVFAMIRIGFFFDDEDVIKRNLEKAQTLAGDGQADWERKNRLKDYEALQHVRERQFGEAAAKFADTMASYSALELFPFDRFIAYTVLCCVLAFGREELKKSIVDSPEVISVLRRSELQAMDVDGGDSAAERERWAPVAALLDSFYECRYRGVFEALADVTEFMRGDRYLAPHSRYYCRQMRINAYEQKLRSYRTVSLDKMAQEFGVSPSFLDAELARFVSVGRLECRIDKVAGTIETIRHNEKTAAYQQIIKNGDLLLNRVQKLSRVVNLT